MIPEAGFLFSIAALNASLAGLGGLFVGLRRGPQLAPLEALRLRQVVEFAFVNILSAVALHPLALLVGGEPAVRLSGAVALPYLVSTLILLRSRVARVGISWGRWWAASAIGLTAMGAATSLATLAQPSAGLYELLLVVMLARPMIVFVLVLSTIDTPAVRPGSTPNRRSR